MARWNDEDGFWESMADEIFSPALLEAATHEVSQVMELLKLAPPANVLDVCCGPGRHSVELARRGFQVTGVDRTPTYLRRARESAHQAGVDLELVQEDARKFVRPGRYDAALNLFTSFGYFDQREEELAMLQHIHESLRPGGQFLVEVNGKEVFSRTFTPSVARELADGSLFVELRTVRPGWEWIDSRWIVVRGTQRVEHRVSVRVYSSGELCALLREVGFAELDVFGSFGGAPYDTTAQRLIVRARKTSLQDGCRPAARVPWTARAP